MKNFNREQGFTFIEMVLVVALMSVISVCLYQTIMNGIRIWERSRAFEHDEDIAITFDKMSQDLKNTFFYSSIPFSGRRDSMAIPTIITVKDESLVIGGEANYKEQIGLVEYAFDEASGQLFRRQHKYGQISSGDYASERVVVSTLTDVKFSYYYLGSNLPADIKINDFSLPLAVRVELTLKEVSGGKRIVTKIIGVPIGG